MSADSEILPVEMKIVTASYKHYECKYELYGKRKEN